MPLKIAMIGAGSIGFTRELMHDVLTVPELVDSTFAFTDISERNLEMVTALCERDISANGLPAKIEATIDRRRVLADADYILCLIRQGGLEAFRTDIEIPLKYGIDQCVGDTLCAGGLMYAQRTIPALLDFCKDIREVSKPGALFMNYSNPMAMNTWACNQYGGVNTVGLCHGVTVAHWQITECVELWAKREGLLAQDEKLHRRDVQVVPAGINHQTWFLKVVWRGIDFLPLLASLFSEHPTFRNTEKVRIDVLKRFGYYSTESNGHLSEYLPWYRKRLDEIPQWIDMSDWINGETGGYLRICTESRNWFETDFPNWMAQPAPTISPDMRTEEHGSYIIEALETGRPHRGTFNVVNNGHITNLPQGCVVEVPGLVDSAGIHMTAVGDLPLGCAATCAASVRVQQMGVEAAVHGDVNLLKLAMLHDPLVGAVCNPEEVWQMTDEMLVAQAQWLPQYADAIPAARERLASAEANGTRVRTMTTQGVARIAVRSAEEMAQDAEHMRRLTATANKGNLERADQPEPSGA
jgi:alpha-galactosidase